MNYDKEYFEDGIISGKSLYQHYRWMPELTIPLAHHIAMHCKFTSNDTILDFGCAKGYLVKALRLLGYDVEGMDISNYAISEAPKDIEKYLHLVQPKMKFSNYDWIIAKDTLEHISYADIDEQLNIFAVSSKNIFVIVPLGDGKKYNIDAYELDITHQIREDLWWWKRKLENAGFKTSGTHDMGPFKGNWHMHNKGNGLLIGSSSNNVESS